MCIVLPMVVAVVKGVLAVGDFSGHLNKIVNMVSPFRLSTWLTVCLYV